MGLLDRFRNLRPAPPEPDVMGRLPVWYMAMEGDLAGVERALAAGTEPDHRDKKGYTMLAVAAFYGHRAVDKALLAARANPNLTDRHGNTVLWEASREATCGQLGANYDIGIIADLLAVGANPEHANKAGKTAPGWADGTDERRLALQATYRAHGYDGSFAL